MRTSQAPLLAVALAVLASCTTTGRPEVHAATSQGAAPPSVPPDRIGVTFEQFQKVLSPRSAVFPLPGGESSLMLMALPGDAYAKVYRLEHATRRLAPLYDAGRNISGLERDHARKHFFVLLDNNGDENTQIYALDVESRQLKKVFGHEGFKASIIDFSMDGDRLYVLSNHDKKETYRAYRVDIRTGKSVALTDGSISFDDGVVDQSERRLALTRMLGNNEMHVYVFDLKTRRLRKLLEKANTVYEPVFFHPAEPALYVNTDDGSDRIGCARVRVVGEPSVQWIQQDPAKDLGCGYSRLEKLSSIVERHDGRVTLRMFDGLFGRELTLPFPDKSVIGSVGLIPGTRVAIVKVSRADDPGELYRVDLDAAGAGQLEQVSEFNQSGISKADFAQSYDFRYPSFDGLSIHSIVYARAEWTNGTQKRPVILWPHGGPDDQERHVFHPAFQFWALNGYVVFAPNFRGSAGYGKKFETLNDRDWGGGHIKDLIWGKRALSQLPYVDPDRVYIVGGSFGGFSTLSAITQYPEEFRGAVAIVALANLFTFMKSIPPDPAWQAEFLREVGDPEKDKAFFEERSPYFHADKIRTPLKIYQAEVDVRTVKAEMDEFVARARGLKIPVEYEILEKEGHGLGRTGSREKVLEGTLEFFERQEQARRSRSSR